ncbi:MAG TPA: 4-aminobutyrate--2-oxoglutarate transaminase, partial [Paracoccus sp. (in: a-proteobacteria)]|nr:4-aminobutyrate--2-oxoglutarate transaminase [Paracoccus sp. (in: a-proteobacteria)]
MTTMTDRKNAAISRGVGMTTQIYADRAENAEIWDRDGKRYIDFAAGIAVVNTGHRHPKVVQAVKDQLDRFTHTCHQVVPYENYVALAERLNRLVPGDFEKKTIFATTGAEAVENAVKIARYATGRSAIIAFTGAFHGRTFMGMTLTGKVQPYKAGFGAMMPDVFHLPFPNDLHGVSQDDALAALDKLFKADVDPGRVAAMIVEPVQGEGGFYPVPSGFMRKLRDLCDKHGMLLIADEVQTGFARTGKLFAMEHHGVAADITCMAKGLGGGLPISAVTGRAEVMDAPNPGGLGGTYAGNPLGVAAAHAVLDVIEEEGLAERAERLGQRLKQRLASLRDDVPEIVDIRGPGLMNAVEFNTGGKPSPEFTNKVREEALDRGLILLTCGVY